MRLTASNEGKKEGRTQVDGGQEEGWMDKGAGERGVGNWAKPWLQQWQLWALVEVTDSPGSVLFLVKEGQEHIGGRSGQYPAMQYQNQRHLRLDFSGRPSCIKLPLGLEMMPSTWHSTGQFINAQRTLFDYHASACHHFSSGPSSTTPRGSGGRWCPQRSVPGRGKDGRSAQALRPPQAFYWQPVCPLHHICSLQANFVSNYLLCSWIC